MIKPSCFHNSKTVLMVNKCFMYRLKASLKKLTDWYSIAKSGKESKRDIVFIKKVTKRSSLIVGFKIQIDDFKSDNKGLFFCLEFAKIKFSF